MPNKSSIDISEQCYVLNMIAYIYKLKTVFFLQVNNVWLTQQNNELIQNFRRYNL